MKLLIVFFVRRLVAQKITIRTRRAHELVFRFLIFAERKGHGTVGIMPFDIGNDPYRSLRRKSPLAALQNKGAKSERVTRFTAGGDVLVR